jgi:hypothetical protein
MNTQALVMQAQKLRKDMMKEKKTIDEMEFEATSSFVKIKMTGDKKVKNVEINIESIEKEDIEMLQDLIMVATNECIKKIEEETEKRMGKFTQGIPGLF